MAKYIKITKIAAGKNFYCYQIAKDVHSESFYMCINPEKEQLTFYLTRDLDKQVGIIDFKSPENERLDFAVIDRGLLWPAVSKAREALDKNEFPDYLDYCA
jgi:hypothetical protein